MTPEQAVKLLDNLSEYGLCYNITEEKDKQIDLMAEDIDSSQIECNRYFKDKEEVKQYFENKAST